MESCVGEWGGLDGVHGLGFAGEEFVDGPRDLQLPRLRRRFSGRCAVGSAQGKPASECQVKAAFLFHFAQFVDWLSQALKHLDDAGKPERNACADRGGV